MTSDRADKTAESTTQTPRRGISKSDEQPRARTERVARSHPIPPVRRSSASDGTPQGTASLQRPVILDGTQSTSNQQGDKKEVGSFGFPTPIIPHDRHPDSVRSGDEAAFDASRNIPPNSRNGESRRDNQDYRLSSQQHHSRPETNVHQGRTVSFAISQDGMETLDTKQSDFSSGEQVKQAFAFHASYQREGSIHSPATGSDSGVTPDTPSPSSAGKGILRTRSATTTTDNDTIAQKAKSKFRLFQRPRRTLILGHKAGLWLTNYAFDSFCQVANALLLHQWNDLGTSRLPKMVGPKRLQNWEIFVDIRDGDKKDKQVIIKPFTEAGRKNYEKSILPVLQKNEPKLLIRVRDGDLECGFECKDPSCDNSRDLEVLVPDVGFLRILADWHRWREQPKLIENSQVFENGVFGLLFPSPDGKNEYMIELPDGSTFHVSRDAYPSLPADVQEALSRITTAESQEGVKPEKIKLMPHTPVQALTMERPPASPSQKSPGLARAEGTIFVHRPANFTHFRYDPPHTMESFSRLARKELYSETEGRLKLRISPSNAFRQSGKLLLPITEHKTSYINPGEDGETREDVWRESIVEKWLTPQEDVWAIKIFDSIQVYDGLRDKDTGHKPEQWDVSALGSRDSDDSEDPGWNIPPETIMDGLAKISLNLLNIDPRLSSMGIVLRVKRKNSSEWLCWKSPMTFLQFQLEVLYKIDGEAIAIYPGDYEEPDVEQSETLQAMKQLAQKKTIAKDAIEAFNMPEVKRNPAQADGRFNNLGHLGIQLPQTTWNPEGTHLEPTPSYATNALIYSASDMGLLQQRLFRAESEVLMREEACRVCGLTFLKRSGGKDLDRTTEINNHYASHVMAGPRACSMKGCEEDLGNPNKYSTWADIVEHISSHGQRTCSTPNCHCPLWLLTHEQLTEHLELHPDTSSLRNQVAEAPSTLRRESATQTNPIALDPNFRYEPQIEDSLTERPVGDVRLWCGICNSYLDDLTQKEKEHHAKQCKIPVEDLTLMEFNKSFKVVSGNPITTLKSRYKPTTRRIVQGGTTSTVEATTTIRAAVDQLASTTALGRGKRNAATSRTPNEVMSSNLPEETADQSAPAKGGKGRKAQTDTKAARAATATQPDSGEHSATATPKTSDSSSGKLPRKRGPTAKAKIPDDPDEPADPPKPARKTRARQTKLENEPATTTEDPQPESSKQTRASRAKKTNNQAEGTGQPQASSSVPADTPGSSLHPPAPEEKTADTPETTETKAPTTRRTRAKTTTTTTTTTSPRKRKTPAPKTTSPAKRRKTAKNGEEVAETASTIAAGSEDTATHSPDPPAHDANNNDNNDSAKSTSAKGKARTPAPKSKAKPPTHKTPAPKPPTTRSSPRKRDNSATTTEEPTTDPPPTKRRKVETSEGGVRAQPSSTSDGGVVPSVEQAGAVAAGVADGDGEGGDGKVEGEGGDAGEGEAEAEGEGEQTASSSTSKRKRTPTPKAAASATADKAEGEKKVK